MLFNYKAIDKNGVEQSGVIDAMSLDVAILSLQRRGFILTHIKSSEKSWSLFESNINFFERVKGKDIVVLSRQMATLFAAQISALRIFRLLASEAEKLPLQRVLTQVADDVQSGDSISKAMSKHAQVFSDFYVNMVRAGEESGKLDETFMYLADYLDRNYEISSKVKSALIYPAFVFVVFFVVLGLMMTMVIPNIATILRDSGQDLPAYTRFILNASDFVVTYWAFLLIFAIIAVYLFIAYVRTEKGRFWFDSLKIKIPAIGKLAIKLYVARIADNLSTMLQSGIPIAHAIDITANVVGNTLYKSIMNQAGEAIRSGSGIADALARHKEIPGIVTQMTRVGEESGELGSILKTLAKFYNREVTNAVNTLIGLIEPFMIVVLGIGVAFLLASVLVPIYNFSTTIQ